MATDAIERARSRKAQEDIVRKLKLIMDHLGIVDPADMVEETPAPAKAETPSEPDEVETEADEQPARRGKNK